MNAADIQAALGQRLAATSGIPEIVWGNKDADPALPYVAADFVPVTRTDDTLAGTMPVETGYLMASVVSVQNEFATPALVIAQAIADQFPQGLRLSITGATVVIIKPAFIARGYPDGPNWRTPVRIDYRAD